MYEEDAGETQVFNPDDPLMGVEWSVNLSDDETRTMRAPDIAFEYLRGGLNPDDTFVWREGMGDWIPLGQCQELLDVIHHYEGGHAQPTAASQPAPAPEPAADPYAAAPLAAPPEDEDEFASTVMMDANSDQMQQAHAQAAASSGHGFGSPDFGSPQPDEVSQTLAAPYDASDEEDPFADARPPEAGGPPPGPRRVGERNEASALFSLDQIRAEAEALSKDSSTGDDPFGDIMSLGGGGGGIAGAFAPPPINAPAPPPPPPKPQPPPVQASVPPPAAAAASMPPAAMSQVPAPEGKSRKGLIIGAILGVLVVVGGVAAFALSGSDPSEEPTAQSDGAGEDAAKDEGDDQAKPPEDGPSEEGEKLAEGDEDEKDQDDKDEDEKDQDDKDEDEKDEDAEETKTAKADDDKSSVATTTKTTTSSAEKDDDDKKASSKTNDDDKKDEKKDTKKAEFNRDAARSALAAAAGAASGCKQEGGPTGRGRVTVTFAPSGRATQATVGAPFAGTSVGSCAAGAFRGASVPPFSGNAITVSKSFFIK